MLLLLASLTAPVHAVEPVLPDLSHAGPVGVAVTIVKPDGKGSYLPLDPELLTALQLELGLGKVVPDTPVNLLMLTVDEDLWNPHAPAMDLALSDFATLAYARRVNVPGDIDDVIDLTYDFRPDLDDIELPRDKPPAAPSEDPMLSAPDTVWDPLNPNADGGVKPTPETACTDWDICPELSDGLTPPTDDITAGWGTCDGHLSFLCPEDLKPVGGDIDPFVDSDDELECPEGYASILCLPDLNPFDGVTDPVMGNPGDVEKSWSFQLPTEVEGLCTEYVLTLVLPHPDYGHLAPSYEATVKPGGFVEITVVPNKPRFEARAQLVPCDDT